jgi:hypothetical protein
MGSLAFSHSLNGLRSSTFMSPKGGRGKKHLKVIGGKARGKEIKKTDHYNINDILKQRIRCQSSNPS